VLDWDFNLINKSNPVGML